MNIVINILTAILVLTSLALVMVVLMQRAKTDGGMGAAMAGGATESAFGAETNNVLTTFTIRAAIVFFVLSFTLFLLNIYQVKHQGGVDAKLPTIVAPAAPASAGPAPVTLPAPQPATPPPGEAKKP
ncbi:MAG TPA: preprotein translocase subunit SecG [Lacunisphaera sp.]|nr:preprotein translocase subunit SecG [Lacunisphaera sp.]